jgi:pimeloyl-ACP methyl ester carboxylesterase
MQPLPSGASPFRQGRFEDIPARPRLSHGYFETRVEEVPVETPALGRMRTHVRVHGSGPPLLLVHGLMTTSYSWRYALAPLGERFTCYAPDLPGAGRTDRANDHPYHPEAIAQWLGALQRALGIRGERVIGNSMGGYLCLRLALSDPDAISRLVCAHAPGVPELRLLALGAALAIPGARAVLSRVIRRDPHRWAHANVHYWDESLKSMEEAREYGDPLASPEGAAAFIKYLAETMALGPIKEFQRVLFERRMRNEPFPVKTLLLYARRDPMVPPRFGPLLAERLGVPLVWLDEGSHFAHVDALDRFLPPVLEFLA